MRSWVYGENSLNKPLPNVILLEWSVSYAWHLLCKKFEFLKRQVLVIRRENFASVLIKPKLFRNEVAGSNWEAPKILLAQIFFTFLRPLTKKWKISRFEPEEKLQTIDKSQQLIVGSIDEAEMQRPMNAMRSNSRLVSSKFYHFKIRKPLVFKICGKF